MPDSEHIKIDHRLAAQPMMSIYRVDLPAFNPHSRKDTPEDTKKGNMFIWDIWDPELRI